MANKKIQIDLVFNSDVTKAKAAMKELQNSLSNLATKSVSGDLKITPQLQQASKSAMQLKIALQNATNVNTGKLNLNQFQVQLKKTGKNIEDFAKDLAAMGPKGVEAFSQVTSAISSANTKIFNLNGSLKKLSETFMNTIRWQVTSSALNMVTSAFAATIDYAKDLDASLNKIQIVTGKTANEMKKFAKEANNMAKALNTTTIKYSDASLIYFQQGLDANEVKKRTDTTVKLANVVGENAKAVSEWMTAIWNNFDDGSKSLEYYADVLAQLGAATASSADEIAGGLEKFAAVSDTIGLSYEYAASMLATITAETRQSEDVVGTALKTILSRMEQLSLGETLDDGTSLGKYSLALQTVGVNIKDVNGELKDADVILQQTGEAWQLLGRDQQIALAQSVAGIRQYTQFMALMDNWDVMEKNLELTKAANGALQEQNEIYSDSVEAAEKRMTTSAEKLMSTLLDGDTLKPFYEAASDILEVVNTLVESFGGLPGILTTVASLLLKGSQQKITDGFRNTAQSIKEMSLQAVGLSTNQAFKKRALGSLAKMQGSTAGIADQEQTIAQQNYEIEQKILALEEKVGTAKTQQIKWEIQLLKTQQQKYIELAKEKDLREDLQIAAQNAAQESSGHSFTSSLEASAEKNGILRSRIKHSVRAINEISETGDATKQQKTALGETLMSDISREKEMFDLNLPENSKLKEKFDTAENIISDYSVNSKASIEELRQAIVSLNGEIMTLAKQELDFAKLGPQESDLDALIDKTSSDEDGRLKPKHQGYGGSFNEKIFDADMKKASEFESFVADEDTKIQLQDQKEQVFHKADNVKKAQSEVKKLEKAATKDSKKNKELEGAKRKLTKATKELNRAENDYLKNLKNAEKQGKKTNKINGKIVDTYEGLTEAQEDAIEKTLDANEANENASIALEGVKESTEDVIDGIDKVDTQDWADNLYNVANVAMSVVSSFQMMQGAFSNLSKEIMSGGAGFDDWIGFLTSFIGSSMQTISSIASINTMLEAHKKKKQELIDKSKELQGEENKETAVQQENVLKRIAAAWKEAMGKDAANFKEKMSNIGAAITGIVKQIAAGPGGWATAAASLAMIAALAGPIIGSISGISGGAAEAETEKQEEAVDTSIENLEAIDENQELAASVSDLTKEYNELKAAGDSTFEVQEKLKESASDLIKSYEKLGTTIGQNIDITQLKAAYEYAMKTGEWDQFTAQQEKIDKRVAEIEAQTAESGAVTAGTLMLQKANNDKGEIKEGIFKKRMADSGTGHKEALDIMESTMGEYLDIERNDADKSVAHLNIDTSSPTAAVDAYEKMQKALNEMRASGLTDTQLYKDIAVEVEEMSEAYEDAKLLADKFVESQLKVFQNSGAENMAKDIFGTMEGITPEAFEKNRDALLQKMQDEMQITKEQAEAMLSQVDIFKDLEFGYTYFQEDGKIARDVAQNGAVALETVKQWFNSVPEEDRTLFIGLDFTKIDSEEEMLEALQEKRNQVIINEAKTEAEAVGVAAETFEAYTDLLMDNNSALEDNEVLASQVAIAQVKLNKGLEKLHSSWNDNAKALISGNKNTLEYAEALGEVSKALEEAFGVKPSTQFIQNNLSLISSLANGNVEALDEMQNKLAEDYVLTMPINDFSINENAVYGTAEEVRNTLTEMLNSIDTNIALGEETFVDQKYYDAMQQMLDAGQVTEEQLQKLFTAKGYTLKIDGYKWVDGPEKTITYTDSRDEGSSYQITEQERIKVPIINGDTSNIEVASGSVSNGVNASLVKSTNASSINTSLKEAGSSKSDRMEDFDRYHKINQELSTMEKKLDKISAAKDRAFGKNRVAYFNQEIAASKELLTLEEEKLKKAEKYLEVDKQALLSKYAVQIDANGTIINYDQLYEQYAGSMSDDSFEDFKKAIELYEESLEIVQDQQQAVIDKENEIRDLALEKVQYAVEYKIEVSSDAIEILDHQLEKLEDTAYEAAEAIQLIGKKVEELYNQNEINKQGIIDSLFAADDNGKSTTGFRSKEDVERLLDSTISEEEAKQILDGTILTEQQKEFLRDSSKTLLELEAEINEQWTNSMERLNELGEAWNEKLDEGITKIEYANSILTSYKNIIDLVGKDSLGISNQLMKQLSKATIDTSINAISAARAKKEENEQNLEYYEQERAKAAERLNNAVTDAEKEAAQKSIDKWDEQIKIGEEKVRESTEEFMGSWESGLEACATAFSDNIETIIDNFSKSVSGIYGTIDDMIAAFDRMQEVNDRYVEGYKKTYELNKLNRQILNSIDSTDNVKAQRMLAELQSEVNSYQAEGVQMTKYDLEYMQKKYDLRLAEIALEDAQNAKTAVKLQRDSQGNFGYVYTADENNIADTQQKYEDAAMRMSEFYDNLDKELTQSYYNSLKEFEDGVRELKEKYGEGTEEFEAGLAELKVKFEEDTGYITSTFETFANRGIQINRQYGINVFDTFKNTILGQMNTQYDTWEQLTSGTTQAVNSTIEEVIETYREFKTNVEEAMKAAGTSTDGFKDKVNDAATKIPEDTEKIAKEVKEDSEAMAKAIDEATNALTTLQQTLESSWASVANNTTLAGHISKVISWYDQIAEAANKAGTAVTNNNSKIETGKNGYQNTGNTESPQGITNSLTAKKTYRLNGQSYTKLSNGKVYKTTDLTKGKDGTYTINKGATASSYYFTDKTIKGQIGAVDRNKLKEQGWVSTLAHDNIVFKSKSDYDKYYDTPPSSKAQWINFSDTNTIIWQYNKTGMKQSAKSLSDLGLDNKNYLQDKTIQLFKPSKAQTKDLIGIKFSKELKNGYDDTLFTHVNIARAFTNATEKQLNYFKSFDTGGYTGSWGPEGRIAMLHQKEIVLNTHDTENFLSAIELVRSLSERVDLTAAAQAQRLAEWKLESARATVDTSGIEQNITIHAEFPAVQDRFEIEEAFNSLALRASQYVNRK